MKSAAASYTLNNASNSFKLSTAGSNAPQYSHEAIEIIQQFMIRGYKKNLVSYATTQNNLCMNSICLDRIHPL